MRARGFHWLLLGLLAAPAAWADTPAGTLGRVRAEGVVRCGAAVRPGLAFPDQHHQWHGLLVDTCRAVAAAALGDPERYAFHAYLGPRDFRTARDGTDAVAFVDGEDMLANDLLGALLPGTPVFFVTQGFMVPEDSPVRGLADLGRSRVCVEPGTETERGIAAYLAAHHVALNESPFQEQEEMVDAFTSGRCPVIAEETTTLAAMRADGRGVAASFRILPDAAAPSPLYAATPLADARWSALVGWTIGTLLRAAGTGADTDARGALRWLPVAAPELGLDAGWQRRVLQATGPYGAIYRRDVGDGSPLGLPAGPNGAIEAGGVLAAPLAR